MTQQTGEIQGPISPQDAEVIAGWCAQAAMYFWSEEDHDRERLWQARAAAVRAAAREPLGDAWAVVGPFGLRSVGDRPPPDFEVEFLGEGYRAVRVAIYEEGGE